MGFSLNYKDFDTYSISSSALISYPSFRAIVDLGATWEEKNDWENYKDPTITNNLAFHSCALNTLGCSQNSYDITIDFGGSYTVTGMVLLRPGDLDTAPSNVLERYIKKFVIEYSADGTTFTALPELDTTQASG